MPKSFTQNLHKLAVTVLAFTFIPRLLNTLAKMSTDFGDPMDIDSEPVQETVSPLRS